MRMAIGKYRTIEDITPPPLPSTSSLPLFGGGLSQLCVSGLAAVLTQWMAHVADVATPQVGSLTEVLQVLQKHCSLEPPPAKKTTVVQAA